jgi:hypothetical protein
MMGTQVRVCACSCGVSLLCTCCVCGYGGEGDSERAAVAGGCAKLMYYALLLSCTVLCFEMDMRSTGAAAAAAAGTQ